MSACLHQPRNVSGLIPTLGPIRFAAAFNDSPDSSPRASATRRIALSRNSCGYFLGAGMTDPSADQGLHFNRGDSGQVTVLRTAHRVAGVDPGTISYVETHGTGTSLGDPIEFEALTEALGREGVPCTLGTLKAQIGHLSSAAGIAGLIKTVLALEHRVLPPSPYFHRPNPQIDLDSGRFRLNAAASP